MTKSPPTTRPWLTICRTAPSEAVGPQGEDPGGDEAQLRHPRK